MPRGLIVVYNVITETGDALEEHRILMKSENKHVLIPPCHEGSFANKKHQIVGWVFYFWKQTYLGNNKTFSVVASLCADHDFSGDTYFLKIKQLN